MIWRGTEGIYIGQNSDGLGGEYHGRFAAFPLSGGRTVPAVSAPGATTGYPYSGGSGGQLTKTFAPPMGSAYYLIVPHNGAREGSYGAASNGIPTPLGQNACYPQQAGVCE